MSPALTPCAISSVQVEAGPEQATQQVLDRRLAAEDPVFWKDPGAAIAKRNLTFSVLSEHIGFSVWSMWSVIVLFMGPEWGIDPAGKFLLTALPTLAGAALRLPYTFAVATSAAGTGPSSARCCC